MVATIHSSGRDFGGGRSGVEGKKRRTLLFMLLSVVLLSVFSLLLLFATGESSPPQATLIRTAAGTVPPHPQRIPLEEENRRVQRTPLSPHNKHHSTGSKSGSSNVGGRENIPLEGSTTAIQHQRHSTPPSPEMFLMFNSLYSWYGLTNQLMCYSAAIRYGMESGRAIVLPEETGGEKMAVTFYDLFDRSKTQALLDKRFHRWVSSSSSLTARENGRDAQKDNVDKRGDIPVPSSPPTTPPCCALNGRPYAPIVLSRLRDVPASLLPPTSMNKKSLYLPKRNVFHSDKHALEAQGYLKKIVTKSDKYKAVRHHNFFMRFPWIPSMGPLLGEAGIMSSLVFSKVIRDRQQCIVDRMKKESFWASSSSTIKTTQGRKNKAFTYAAVHLRIESDATLIRPNGARNPNPEQVLDFLRRHVLGFVAQQFLPQRQQQPLSPSPQGSSVADGNDGPATDGVDAIYLCTGTLSPELRAALATWDGEVPIFTRNAGPFGGRRRGSQQESNINCSSSVPLPVATGAQRKYHQEKKGVKQTQDHYRAAVDLLMMAPQQQQQQGEEEKDDKIGRGQHSSGDNATDAAAVAIPIVPDYSTFRFAVYARSCDEVHLPRANASDTENSSSVGVWSYSVSNSGDFQAPVFFSCAGRSASWAGHRQWGS